MYIYIVTEVKKLDAYNIMDYPTPCDTFPATTSWPDCKDMLLMVLNSYKETRQKHGEIAHINEVVNGEYTRDELIQVKRLNCFIYAEYDLVSFDKQQEKTYVSKYIVYRYKVV